MSGWILAGVLAGSMMGSGGAAAVEVADTVRWVTAEEGNEVRYRVREQLASIDFPSDAVGVTTEVHGAIEVADDGTLVGSGSRFVINVDSLASDSERRDNYLRRRTLETELHPQMMFDPESFDGLAWPLPESGEVTFRLRGGLTVKGVTRQVVWEVTASVTGDRLTGTARTEFTFADLELSKPSVRSVLSVNDEIRLEYDFALVREGS